MLELLIKLWANYIVFDLVVARNSSSFENEGKVSLGMGCKYLKGQVAIWVSQTSEYW